MDPTKRTEFARGWCCWVLLGDLNGYETEPYVNGFNEAARSNERGGARPTCADADDAARDFYPEA